MDPKFKARKGEVNDVSWPKAAKKDCRMAVVTSLRTYTMYCNSAQEIGTWLQALMQAGEAAARLKEEQGTRGKWRSVSSATIGQSTEETMVKPRPFSTSDVPQDNGTGPANMDAIYDLAEAEGLGDVAQPDDVAEGSSDVAMPTSLEEPNIYDSVAAPDALPTQDDDTKEAIYDAVTIEGTDMTMPASTRDSSSDYQAPPLPDLTALSPLPDKSDDDKLLADKDHHENLPPLPDKDHHENLPPLPDKDLHDNLPPLPDKDRPDKDRHENLPPLPDKDRHENLPPLPDKDRHDNLPPLPDKESGPEVPQRRSVPFIPVRRESLMHMDPSPAHAMPSSSHSTCYDTGDHSPDVSPRSHHSVSLSPSHASPHVSPEALPQLSPRPSPREPEGTSSREPEGTSTKEPDKTSLKEPDETFAREPDGSSPIEPEGTTPREQNGTPPQSLSSQELQDSISSPTITPFHSEKEEEGEKKVEAVPSTEARPIPRPRKNSGSSKNNSC